MNQIDYNSAEYKRSRVSYMAQSTFEYFIALLVSDVFLAKLLTSLGLSDALVGIVSSFISIAFIIQLASIPLVRTKMSTKKLVIIFDTLSQLFYMFMYFVPFLPIGATEKKLLVVVLILLAYIFKYLIISICFKWANSYVAPTKRATYSAIKEMISLVSGIAFTMIMGYIIDRYESLGNLNGGFLFIAISMLVINICNFVCLLMIKKESKEEHDADNKPWGDVLKNTVGNRNFRSIVIFTMVFQFAIYFSVGFLGVFKTKDLALSVFAVQVINMISNGCRVLISIPFGRFSDKYSFAKGFELALAICFVGYICLMFTTAQTWFLIVAYSILYNVSVAGTNQNSYNIVYSYVQRDYITQAMAIKNCIGGAAGFVASLLGGKLLSYIQGNGNMLFGIPVLGQQVLAVISAVFLIVSLLIMHFVIGKQKIKIQ